MAGFSRRSFGLSLGMMLALLSLGGVPPLAGFFAKFYVFQAALSSGLVWLAVIGVLNAIVGLYYYLIIIKVLFVDRGEGDDQPISGVSGTLRAGLALSVVGILFLGIFATPWYDLATQAARALLGPSG
jgi:NADH-quinone oxidoreductase subunit N